MSGSPSDLNPSSRGGRLSAGRAARLVLIFLAAAFGVGAWFSEVRPFADVPLVREKLAYFSQHADEYDTLFFGTSRVYRGIMPAVFDRITREAGQPTHSFNFGIDGMFPPEDAYVFERILARPPKNLRWVFLETNPVRAEFGDRDPDSVRCVYWHDFARTSLACQTLLLPEDRKLKWRKVLFGSEEERHPLSLALTHVRLFGARMLNFGRGRLLIDALSGRDREPPKVAAVVGSAGDGFVAAGVGRLWGAERTEYERRYLERQAKPARKSALDAAAQRNFDAMLAALRGVGARPVVLIPPTLAEHRHYPQEQSGVAVFDFSDLEQWAELFRQEHRTDRTHLNAAGAAIYTRAVAEQFLTLANRAEGSAR
jgi:hypothetical protein